MQNKSKVKFKPYQHHQNLKHIIIMRGMWSLPMSVRINTEKHTQCHSVHTLPPTYTRGHLMAPGLPPCGYEPSLLDTARRGLGQEMG